VTGPPPSPPALDRCGTCGQPAPDIPRCPHCGAALLVELHLTAPVTEPRALHLAAREAAALGLPGLDFAAVRVALSRPGRVGAPLERGRARALLAALARAGVSAEARAAAGRAASGSRTAVAVAGALAAAAIGVHALLQRGPTTPPAAAQAAPPQAPGTASPPSSTAAPAAAPVQATPAPLGTAEIARRAGPATAVLSCESKSGTGFFVAPDHLLTNAHVTCGKGTAIRVVLPGGRELLGEVREREEWLDYAVVEVPGAAVSAPIPVGDSTALPVGARVVLIGTPRGLGATVHEARVSHVGRALLGVAYVQFDGNVNPGNSGGPMLDDQGRAVGIVTLKVTGADAVGLALPVEYALPALPRPPAQEEAARSRWSATRARTAAEEQAELARLTAQLERPMPMGAFAANPRSIGLVVMQRWPQGTDTLAIAAELREAGRVVCTASGAVRDWTDVGKLVRERLRDPDVERQVQWMARQQLMKGVHAGAAELDVAHCPQPLPPGTVLAVRGSLDPDATVRVPEHALAVLRSRAPERELAAASARERRLDETSWRRAFRDQRARVLRLEEKQRTHRTELETQRSTYALQKAREELPGVERELAAAREELDDLERRASHAGVPREWR